MRLRKNYHFKEILLVVALFITATNIKAQTRPVDAYGHLSVSGTSMVNQNNEPVMLQGMSLFWSQWEPEFYVYSSVQELRDEWCTNIVRAAMAVDQGGYLSNPSREENKVRTIVEAAIDLGMYVLIDWHDHHGEDNTAAAVEFFSRMAEDYGSYPNVLYEVYNEPLNVNWSNTIKPHCEAVIEAIREHDPDNIIICGTRNWSQRVDEAAADPITGYDNIMYTLHFYAGTHGADLRGWAETAMNNGIALFVTEFGTVNADGGGAVDVNSSNTWFSWMEQYNISHCNWSLCDKDEGSAVLTPGTGPGDNYASNLTTAGNFMYNRFTSNCPVYNVTGPPSINSHPQNQTLNEGEDATFTVSASGAATLTYQWQKNGVNIQGATSNSLTISNVTATDEGAYRVVVTNGEGTETSNAAQLNILSPGPFNGVPFPIPGAIQAEEYDEGGQDNTYYDSSPGNEGGAFRSDDVDIDVISGQNYTIGWVVDGEWLEYSVDVLATGEYDFEFNVATPQSGKTFHVEFDGVDVTGTVDVPNTGDWDAFQTVTINGVNLSAGEHTMRVVFTSDGLNLDYINVIGQSIPDCAGVPDGTAYVDECGDCVGGTTGNTTANFDNDSQPDCVDNDDDNDGVNDNEDCDPFNASIGAGSTWYADNDDDSLGDPDNSIQDCVQPTGYVSNNNDTNDDDFDNDGVVSGDDCDDTNAGVGAATVYYEDADGDGVGSGTGTNFCDNPGSGWVINNGDNCPSDINKTEPGECGCGLQEGTCDDCAGVPNGTAAIDECGVCAGGTTGNTPGATCQPPVITSQPESLTVDEGTSASFSVEVEGTTPFTFQWYLDGEEIDGATSATHIINSASFADAGVYSVSITNDDGSVTSEDAILGITVDGQTPYNGTPIHIPGTLQAQEFDLGGQDVAYNDVSDYNEGGAFRDEWVDLEDNTDNGGLYHVGWTADGEWLEYTVEVTETGYYDFEFRVASDLDAGEFNIEVNGSPIIANITVGNTGGWQSFETVTQEEVPLDAGVYVWRLNIIDGEFNINYITVTPTPTDCNGDPNGTAYIDNCGECVGGLTGNTSTDTDDDGVIDCEDSCPQDPNKTAPGLCGCGNVDEDIDNDGVCDLIDDFIDVDEDGVAQGEDCDDNDENIGEATVWYADTDNDGIGDAGNTTASCDQPAGYVAIAGDECPQDSEKTIPGLCGCGNVDEDIDNDGICDLEDTFIDVDEDGIAQGEDCDDNDENIGEATVWYADTDNDGIGDSGNTTTSCDQPAGYVAIAGDECPQDSEKTTPGLCGCGFVDEDIDNDGVCDLEDNDLDNDGIAANEDCDDNDPNVGEGTIWYADVDNDGVGDAGNTITSCDQPNGYVANAGDECPQDQNKTTSGLCGCGNVDQDVDNDGICDLNDNDLDNDLVPSDEDCDDNDPGVGGPTVWYRDSDNDGVGATNETTTSCSQPAGYVATAGDQCPQDGNKTAPGSCGCGVEDADDDNDGVLNCDDLCNGADDNIDFDNDGIPDGCDADDDNDNVADNYDCDPFDNMKGYPSVWYADTDNDGVGDSSDGVEACDQPSGYVAVAGDNCPQDGNKTNPGTCGCGVSEVDTDVDGVPDCLDQCPQDANKIEPGLCGCGVIDVDADNDGVCDNSDDDIDNDNVPNSQDCAPTNPNIGEPTVWYEDVDNDGVGNHNIFIESCTRPSGYVTVAGDACVNDPNKVVRGDCGCGVEEGTCQDCAGVPFGNAYYDNCDNCVTSKEEECAQDCNGDWGGTAAEDICGECSGGNTGRTPVMDVQKCSATGIEDELNKIAAKVYPNPFEDNVHIEVDGEFTFIVYDIAGVEIQHTTAKDQVKIGDWWKPGMYIIQLIKDDYAVNVKVEKH